MSKRVGFISILAWGIALALLLLSPSSAQADDGNDSGACEFQPMASDRSPTMSVISTNTQIPENLSPDKSYLGLHRWQPGQWPGVDYLVETTVAFKNGGVVSIIEWDNQGGGNSIYIDGIGPCQGWRQFFGHLNYDASTKFKVGQIIGPDEVVGVPGCSGFESSCSANGGYIPIHNHVTLGYWQNIFSFSDGTTPDFAGGYWWIHPSRVEGEASSQPKAQQEESAPSQEQPAAPETSSQPQTQETQPEPQGSDEFYLDYSVQKTFAANLNVSQFEYYIFSLAEFKQIIIIALAILAICWIGGMIYSTQFRRSMVTFGTIAVIVLLCFVGVGKVMAKSNLTSPPRDAEYTVNYSPDEWTVADYQPETKPEENSSPSNNSEQTEDQSSEPAPESKEVSIPSSDGCSLPTSYPESIRRWCPYIEKWASARSMDPKWIAAVMLQESGGNPEILSASGAVGLLQVMPRDGIAASFHNENGVPYFSDRPSIDELKNPDFNIEYGSGMLSSLGINSDPRNALLRYGPRPDDLLAVYGSRYYYADLIISIYNSYQ